MKLLLTTFFVALLTLLVLPGYAQTSPTPQPDDEFNLFLLSLAIAFFSVVIGAILAGGMLVAFALVGLFALVSAGVVSVGVVVGLYKRSVTAGFKTVLALICSLSGILVGGVAFYFVNRAFHIHLSGVAAILVGGFGGLVAGMLLGFLVLALIRLFLNYCRQKLSF